VRRRPSIRLRVTIVVATVVALALSVLSFVLAGYALQRQLDSLDDDLAIDARVVTQVFQQQAQTGTSTPLRDTGREVQLVDADGTPILPDADQEPLLGEGPVEAGNVTHELEALGRYRFRIRPVPEQDGLYLVVGRSVEQVYDANEALRRALAIAVPVLSLAFAALAYLVVGRALRPVEQVRGAVSRITEHDLDQRIPLPGTGDEIDRLTITMNAMLDRIEEGSRRERQLVADASHELRSPLAAARALVESRPDDPVRGPEHDAAAVAALARLQALMEQLLVLARHDSSEGLPDLPVDLDDLVLQRADALRAAHPELTVDTSEVSGGQVRGSADALGRVIDNLTSNAARHARSTVRFRVTESEDQVEIVITDDGPGVPAPDRQRIFERFTRLDEARAAKDGGAGLGLAIAAEIVERHQGSISVQEPCSGAGGASFEVRIPAA
jgi:signal transduction histidine kinase